MHKILMIGPQGSGKGTQAELLAEHLKIPTIAMGRLLRQEVKKEGKLSKKIKKFIDKGKLVSDDITDELIRQWMEENDSSQGWILDGFPRRMNQLEQLLEFEQPTEAVLINLDDETAVDRLSARRTCFECGKVYHLKFNPPEVEGKCECGGELKHRDDDKPKAIRERLKIYHSDTEDLIERYRSMGILVEVDGKPGIKEVQESIIKKL